MSQVERLQVLRVVLGLLYDRLVHRFEIQLDGISRKWLFLRLDAKLLLCLEEVLVQLLLHHLPRTELLIVALGGHFDKLLGLNLVQNSRHFLLNVISEVLRAIGLAPLFVSDLNLLLLLFALDDRQEEDRIDHVSEFGLYLAEELALLEGGPRNLASLKVPRDPRMLQGLVNSVPQAGLDVAELLDEVL